MALAPKLTVPAGRGGGGGRGANESVVAKLTQAKNGFMAGMPATDVTTKASAEAKAQMPKLVSDANALFARVAPLSSTLAKYNLKLTVPDVKAPVLKSSSQDQSRR